jgi:hypothetical protein
MSGNGNDKEPCDDENGTESYDCAEDERLVGLPVL